PLRLICGYVIPMDKTQINPWTWQDAFGFSQAWQVEGAQRLIFVSGQGALAPDGSIVGEGDFERQTQQVFENLRAVLEKAGAGVDAVVNLTVSPPDTATLRACARTKAGFISGPHPASTAVQVVALALPAMVMEVEAIAVA